MSVINLSTGLTVVRIEDTFAVIDGHGNVVGMAMTFDEAAAIAGVVQS